MNTYVLVADSGEAKLYRADSRLESIELVRDLHNPEGRLTRSELSSDRPGMQRSGVGGTHGLGGDKDPHEHASDTFARELCDSLHKEHLAGNFQILRIAAPPHFLGLLRRHLHKDCKATVAITVDKDLVRADTDSLRQHLL